MDDSNRNPDLEGRTDEPSRDPNTTRRRAVPFPGDNRTLVERASCYETSAGLAVTAASLGAFAATDVPEYCVN